MKIKIVVCQLLNTLFSIITFVATQSAKTFLCRLDYEKKNFLKQNMQIFDNYQINDTPIFEASIEKEIKEIQEEMPDIQRNFDQMDKEFKISLSNYLLLHSFYFIRNLITKTYRGYKINYDSWRKKWRNWENQHSS